MGDMTEQIKAFITSLSSNPLLYLPLLSLLICLALRFWKLSLIFKNMRAIKFLFALLIVNYLMLVIYYFLDPSYFDHAEASTAIISWYFIKNLPVYHLLDSAEFYNRLYGPMVFIINGIALDILGAGILASKAAGVFSAILSVVCIFALVRKMRGLTLAIMVTGYACLLFQLFYATSFWCRPDPLILVLVSISFLTLVNGSGVISTIVLALSLGIAINLKIHSFLYFIPIFTVFYSRAGNRRTVVLLFLTLIISILPFVLFDNISLFNYSTWMKSIAGHDINPVLFFDNVEWAIYLTAPIILLSGYLYFENAKYFKEMFARNIFHIVVFVVSMLGVCWFGAVAAAGRYHLLPLIPVCCYSFVILADKLTEVGIDFRQSRLAFTCLTVVFISVFSHVFVFGILREVRVIRSINEYRGCRVVEDIKGVIKSNPDKIIAMGYSDIRGSKYKLTFYRPVLVFSGNPYPLDPVALIDNALSGYKIPPKALQSLRNCNIDIWLVPKGEIPFSGMAVYDNRPVFGDNFRTVFNERYCLVSETDYFDIWACSH